MFEQTKSITKPLIVILISIYFNYLLQKTYGYLLKSNDNDEFCIL
jgi:hypothetical protein